jgi:hypothetical protein
VHAGRLGATYLWPPPPVEAFLLNYTILRSALGEFWDRLPRWELGPTVPIYALLKGNGSFEPEEVAMLGVVFEDVLQTLGLVDREDPLTVMVAKSLIEYAKTGIRDPARLKALTFQSFTQQQQQQQQIQRKRG